MTTTQVDGEVISEVRRMQVLLLESSALLVPLLHSQDRVESVAFLEELLRLRHQMVVQSLTM